MLYNNMHGKTSILNGSHLFNFFADQIRCIYKAENALLSPLIFMKQAASMKRLKELFHDYLSQLKLQRIWLDDIIRFLLISPEGDSCDAIDGLIKEMYRIIQTTPEGSMTRDAGLIVALQKAGHYKIATYGSLKQLASSLGMEEVTNLLNKSLQHEKENQLLFSTIADRRVNWLAETE